MTGNANASPGARIGHYRWFIVLLLFIATVLNYVDRQMIALLKPTLQLEFHWDENTYADMVSWFQVAYAVFYIGFGWLVDRLGARIGYTVAFAVWTAGHMLHGFVSSVYEFVAARIILGAGESGGFPASLKAVAEWFPKKERAFATGLFNAGTNIGAIVTPVLVPWITVTLGLGWRWTFIATGLAGIIWLVVWILVYRSPDENSHVGAAELAYIRSDGPDTVKKVAWLKVLGTREVWAFAAAKFLTDPIWWMFLFWLPDFLHRRYGLDLLSFGPPLVVIYFISDIGGVAGGWLSSRLLHAGWSLNRARKIAMLICAVAVIPVAFASHASDVWTAVGIIALATAAHQGFSANLFNLPADTLPRGAVGTAIGIGGFAGAIGGAIMSKYTGWVLERVGSYAPIFVVAASAYLIALLIIHLLTPRYSPARIE